MRGSATWGAAFLTGALILVGVEGYSAQRMRAVQPTAKGPGVTRTVKLSHYFKGIAGTEADTDVFILEGKEPGGTAMVLGCTHGIEPAGMLSGTVLVENAAVTRGRLIVIPHINQSNLTWNEPGQGYPQKFEIKTPFGSRWFRFGARLTNPVDQWPDPDVYVHYPEGQLLAGDSDRDLNRAYPGRPDGTYTQKLAYAICELIRREKVDVSIDLHEAPPEKPLIDAITAHDRAMTVAGVASMNLELEGLKMRIEISPKALRGLSHREWGDHTQTMAFLLEVANPSQGNIRGITDEKLIVEGRDPFYEEAAKLGRLFVPFGKNGHPLKERVGKHLTTIMAILDAYTELAPERGIAIEGVPKLDELMANGIGKYLKRIE